MKRTPNGALVKQKMEAFAYRRKEVVESAPAISQMVESWPALLTENQVYMEFNRIVGKNLKQEFYEGFDRHSVRLMEIFRSKRGHVGKNLADLIQQTRDTDDEDSFRHITIGLLIEHEDAAVPLNPETPQTSRLPDAPLDPQIFSPGKDRH